MSRSICRRTFPSYTHAPFTPSCSCTECVRHTLELASIGQRQTGQANVPAVLLRCSRVKVATSTEFAQGLVQALVGMDSSTQALAYQQDFLCLSHQLMLHVQQTCIRFMVWSVATSLEEGTGRFRPALEHEPDPICWCELSDIRMRRQGKDRRRECGLAS